MNVIAIFPRALTNLNTHTSQTNKRDLGKSMSEMMRPHLARQLYKFNIEWQTLHLWTPPQLL